MDDWTCSACGTPRTIASLAVSRLQVNVLPTSRLRMPSHCSSTARLAAPIKSAPARARPRRNRPHASHQSPLFVCAPGEPACDCGRARAGDRPRGRRLLARTRRRTCAASPRRRRTSKPRGSPPPSATWSRPPIAYAAEAGREMLARRRLGHRCGNRDAARLQPGRAAVVRHRRRRLHSLLGCQQQKAQGLRRTRDRAGIGAARPLSRRWHSRCRSTRRCAPA